MFRYYLNLALRSLRRNPVLAVLMMSAIGLGIGASMTMLATLHALMADPLPERSSHVFHVQIDPRGIGGAGENVEPPNQMTWLDAMNLIRADEGVRQTALSGGEVTIVPPQGTRHAFLAGASYTTAGFFSLFGVPFVDGASWSNRDDKKRARVAVITRNMAERLYGTAQAVGRTLQLSQYHFRVIGVIDDWNPEPRFYNMSIVSYGKPAPVYLPLQTAVQLGQRKVFNPLCWGAGWASIGDGLAKDDQCAWLSFWVQLDTPSQVAAYRTFLIHYSEQQKALGRFDREPNVRLRNVMQWLAYKHAVPANVELETWLSLAFLLVCLVNTVTLLLVKFLRRSGELSIRRALGASRRSIFLQLLVEASLIGLIGGVFGLLLSLLGLWIVRQQPSRYADLAHINGTMLGVTFGLAVCATLLAAIFPAWRACRLAPVRLLKTQ